jgi:hypothetical protein
VGGDTSVCCRVSLTGSFSIFIAIFFSSERANMALTYACMTKRKPDQRRVTYRPGLMPLTFI